MTTAIIILGIVVGVLMVCLTTILAIVLKNSGNKEKSTNQFLENLAYRMTTGQDYRLKTPETPPTTQDAGPEIWTSKNKWDYPTEGLDPTLDTLNRENEENEQMNQFQRRMYNPNEHEDPGLQMEMDRAGMMQSPDHLPPHIRALFEDG